jgi:ribosomal-protein-alanine N-acetyltransferase
MSDPVPRAAGGGSGELRAGGRAGELRAGGSGEPHAGGRSGELHFEEVAPGHAGALAALFERNSVPAVAETFDPFPLTGAEARRIACEPRRDCYYVAARGQDLLGLSMLRGFDEGYEVPSFGIFVDHASQGAGVGRALTAWTIERARLQGCSAVRLSVYADNSAARGIYDSLGFREQERQLVERGGRQVEKIVMRLEFAEATGLGEATEAGGS